MTELTDIPLPPERADCVDLKGQTIDQNDCVRVFKAAPERITLQIRTYGPTAYSRLGVKRPMMTNARLTAEEAEKLIEGLQAFVDSEYLLKRDHPHETPDADEPPRQPWPGQVDPGAHNDTAAARYHAALASPQHEGERPHGIGCPGCRANRKCNQCGRSLGIVGMVTCTNGRCTECCDRFCRHRETA